MLHHSAVPVRALFPGRDRQSTLGGARKPPIRPTHPNAPGPNGVSRRATVQKTLRWLGRRRLGAAPPGAHKIKQPGRSSDRPGGRSEPQNPGGGEGRRHCLAARIHARRSTIPSRRQQGPDHARNRATDLARLTSRVHLRDKGTTTNHACPPPAMAGRPRLLRKTRAAAEQSLIIRQAAVVGASERRPLNGLDPTVQARGCSSTGQARE